MNSKDLARERNRLRAEIDSALKEEDDPLAAYDQFVKWTIKNYPEGDPSSGLVELLEEATRKFKDDPNYKGDLRYLKLWCLYAQHVDKPVTVYAFLLAKAIGSSYALLYEEYAKTLEMDGCYKEADSIYRQGIKKSARPLERLRKRYKEFKERPSSSSTRPATTSRPKETPETNALCHDPFKNHNPSTKTSSKPSISQSSSNSTSTLVTPRDPYSYILTPPTRGRPEKLRFNLSLLFTEAGVEYSVQESRARSMGLLGKKWGPPPPSELSTCSSMVRVNFNEDGQKTVVPTRRISMGLRGEPTVTINTKEALADVFGMYNSPEKTIKVERPGSKHAPIKKIEPVTPAVVRQSPKELSSDENAVQSMVKTPTFKPFVDENAIRKENTTPAPKFKPFVDSETSNKTPFAIPDVNRRALSVKDTTPMSVSRPKLSEKSKASALQPVPEDECNPNVFSKVFTTKERQPLAAAEIPNIFHAPVGDVNMKTPFKVFSRPDQSENAFVPKSAVFTPFADERPPLEGASCERDVVAEKDMHEDYHEASPDDVSDVYTPEIDLPSTYEDAVAAYRVPLGGRFGQFNVMTPITERTFEFTTSTRGQTTPRDSDAVQSAERLAAELRDEDEEGEGEQPDHMRDEYDSSFSSFDDEEPARPFRVSTGHTIPASSLPELEEKTGTLSLIDALTVASSFKPPNPCNPFDPQVVSTLLSLIPVNNGFYDLRDREAKLLEGLQKFAQKRARQSGNTSSRSIVSDNMCHAFSLAGRQFKVSDKLGEGGFGAVFAAKEVKDDDESFVDDEDEDDDGSSMVAVKIVRPRNLWEFHILRRIHYALPAHLRRSVVFPHALYAFRDESFLVLDLCPQGTLLDVVNRASQAGVSQQGACLDELLVVFFTIELLRLMEGIHTAGFIHGDLKIDNCLLRLEDVPGGAAALSSIYSPSGDHGWGCKGIKLIDFGRTIETGLFPSGQQFIADWPVDAKDCLEMRDNKAWTFQADYYGLAGVVYCLLFGKYIDASSVTVASPTTLDASQSRFKISTPFKRYWQGNMWMNLFDILLNPCSIRPDGSLPLCEELGVVRKEMETWLQTNCNRSSGTLKGLLKKIEVSVYSR